jgi:ArsR family transcriptional regulator, lead/cadmium/zinc/bismuth-responsive transcriptional repressor
MRDRCEVYCNDEVKVNRVKKSIEKIDVVTSADLFKALGDVNRLKIALALAKEEEICVCDAANIIDSSLATASHHLRLLRNLGLVGSRKEGKLVFYFLKDEAFKSLIALGSKQKVVI